MNVFDFAITVVTLVRDGCLDSRARKDAPLSRPKGFMEFTKPVFLSPNESKGNDCEENPFHFAVQAGVHEPAQTMSPVRLRCVSQIVQTINVWQ